MNCADLHGYLDSYLSGELPPETRREIAAHLETCPSCTAEWHERARLRAGVRSAVRATPVPAGLDARVRRAVRNAPARPQTGLYAVAAAALVIIGVMLVNLARTRMNPEAAILAKTAGRFAALLNIGLRDHLHCAVFRKYSKQPESSGQIAEQLGPDFAGLVPLVEAKLPEKLRIIQGHHCTAGGREYVHLIVGGDQTLLSVMLTRKLPGEPLASGIYQTGVDRFQVVGFEASGYLVYVVSNLDPTRNLQLAANLAPVVRDYLGGRASWPVG
jgi:anti-sigma factor (TIGR02949 family)